MTDSDRWQLRASKREGLAAAASAIRQIERGLSQLCAALSLAPPKRVGRLPTLEQVRAVIERRRFRFDIFPPVLFSDPAWDILLQLYESHLQHTRLHIARLDAALPVRSTTILRWIEKLEREALILRHRDPHDARRVFVELTQYGQSLMDRYFQRDFTDPERVRRLFEPE